MRFHSTLLVAMTTTVALAATAATLLMPSTEPAPVNSERFTQPSNTISFFRSPAAAPSFDLDRELEKIERAGRIRTGRRSNAAPVLSDAYQAYMASLPKDASGNLDFSKIDVVEYAKKVNALQGQSENGDAKPPAKTVDVTEELDFDDALELLEERLAEEHGDGFLNAVKKSPDGARPKALIGKASMVMAGGDPWSAVGALLAAHDEDDEDPTALVNLAAIANSQNLPNVALALLEEAEDLDIEADDSPAGISERAALLNNRGHALLLVKQYEDAEAPLREALAISPELSEAARNLVHALIKQGKRDEARALVPRAVWRAKGNPKKPFPVRQPKEGEQREASDGSDVKPEDWAKDPFLYVDGNKARIPMSIALDMSHKGQIAWPDIVYAEPGTKYPGTRRLAEDTALATREAGHQLLLEKNARAPALITRGTARERAISSFIESRIGPVWSVPSIDTDKHRLEGERESRILGTSIPTAPASLVVARAEYQMELAADRLYESYWKNSKNFPDEPEARCAAARAENDRNIVELTSIAREYEDRARVFFREAYGLSTAYASNLADGAWHGLARVNIESNVLYYHAHVQNEIISAFRHAAPGDGCYGNTLDPNALAKKVAVDAPICSPASQWASFKLTLGKTASMELTCGKLKFVAELDVLATPKTKLIRGAKGQASLGMHAEAEIDINGTVTVFAGPKGALAGELGGAKADFTVKDGIYAVIGKDGIQDAGFRVVIGSTAEGQTMGGTRDFEVMDFSVVSAI